MRKIGIQGERGVAALVWVLVALFAVGGAAAVVAYVNNHQADIEDEVDEAEAEHAAQTTPEYPDLWSEAGLPEYPSGNVIDKSQGRDLGDGVSVTFTTSDDKATVKAFFDAEMSDRGFAVPSTPDPSGTTYFGVYEQASTQLSLMVVTRDDGLRKVTAKYVEL